MNDTSSQSEQHYFDRHDVRSQFRKSWWDSGYYSDALIPDQLTLGYRSFPESQYIFHSLTDHVTVSLDKMYEASRRIAAALCSLGVRQGDRVAIQVPNCPESVQCFHAVLMLGAVVVPIVHIYGRTEVEEILRRSGARILFMADQWRHVNYLDRIREYEKIPSLERVILVGDLIEEGGNLVHFLSDGDNEFPVSNQSPDDLCLIVFTSGTTAEPKGVCHSHNTLKAALNNILSFEDNSPESVDLLPFPAGHIGGVLNTLKPYFSGSTSVLLDNWDAEAVAKIIGQHKVSSMSSTPFYLDTLLERVEVQDYDISSLKQSCTGAMPVPPAVIARCMHHDIAAYRSYGCSEQPCLSAGTQHETLDKRANTDGKPGIGCKVKIINDQGVALSASNMGEIITIGPQQFLGYLDDVHNLASFTPDGWFKTGDVGFLDEQGYLTVCDRKKDIVIRGGENISSSEVETLLIAHPDILEAAVVAMKDNIYGEKVCAFIITAANRSMSLREVAAHFSKQGVAKQKAPERVIIRHNFPRTPTGKVKKSELRDWINQESNP